MLYLRFLLLGVMIFCFRTLKACESKPAFTDALTIMAALDVIEVDTEVRLHSLTRHLFAITHLYFGMTLHYIFQ